MSTKAWYRLWSATAAFGALLIVVGLFFLSKPTGTVTGRVTFRGKPVYTGAVIIVGNDGVAAVGPIESDGAYTVVKAPSGEVKIGVVSKDPVYLHRVSVLKQHREAIPKAAWNAHSFDRKRWFPIPKDYEEPAYSGLTLRVTRGENHHDIDLK